ncbi:imidazole glycerol phosphate synthase subunit HisH [Cellulomonas sp. ICMP 17802]|uniref:imidazole glycerol phosphate synthase subunit HisH n=1 Tax=Cellulomonas sp. ICMP 17802 TaxID=3239199 RepID=UPI00351B4741
MPAQPFVVVLDHGPDDHAPLVEALTRAGAAVEVTSDKRTALVADGLVVAGSGPFVDVMAGLRAVGADQVVDRRLAGGRAVLAIDVGMHAMFAEGPGAEGLGEWPGVVDSAPAAGPGPLAVPDGSRLFVGLAGAEFHFAHTHAARAFPLLDDWPADTRLVVPVVVFTAGPDPVVAAVENGPLTALLLRPEHSGDAGAQVLARWVESLPTTHGDHA